MTSEEEIGVMETDTSSGSKMIKVSYGVYVFISQLESCIHIEASFELLIPF